MTFEVSTRYAGFAEVDAASGRAIAWAGAPFDPPSMKEDAIRYLEDVHYRSGRIARPCSADIADTFLVFLDRLPVGFIPAPTDDAIVALAASTIGKLVWPIRRETAVLVPRSETERCYLAVLREHWLTPEAAEPMVLHRRGSWDERNAQALIDYGIDIMCLDERKRRRQADRFHQLCETAGVFPPMAALGANEIARRIGIRGKKD